MQNNENPAVPMSRPEYLTAASAKVDTSVTPARFDARVVKIVLRRVTLPLHRPYSTAYATFHDFEPILAEVHLEDGLIGWGEGQIAEGSSAETRAGGWQAALGWAQKAVGRSAGEAIDTIASERRSSKVAATALITGIEMAAGHPLFISAKNRRFPLLVPVSGTRPHEIEADIEASLAAGFKTLKIKVGNDPNASLQKVSLIQSIVCGRASLRIDANRTFTRDDAIAFTHGLDPDGIELVEQPCEVEPWDDNIAVAAASPVPIMLDESLSNLEDVKRAGSVEGVHLCKLKLKRFGSATRLREALELVISLGMRPVLGDGMSTDLGCWMEACIGDRLIFGAGEFSGFMKPKQPLITPPLLYENGDLLVPAFYRPRFDQEALAAHVLEERIFHAG